MTEKQSNSDRDEPVPTTGAMVFQRYFAGMTQGGASDLHLKPGTPPYIRVGGGLGSTRGELLSAGQIEQMVRQLLTPEQMDLLNRRGSVDVAHEIEGSDRFRINVYRQRGSLAVAVRRVTRKIPDFDLLHLPDSLRKIAEERQGLVLLSGPAGSGKSTTIAAMIEHINRTRSCHIVTIEDPIEYLYTDKLAIINQREVGIDVDDFASALKYLMRQDPDVVLIGELRDVDTFTAALQASETGHMVFGTIHASGAAQTIGRILDLFPADVREGARLTLASNLRAVVCQKLLPSFAPGISRVPACEILLNNPSARQLIAEGRDGEISDLIRSNERDGMLGFTRSLMGLIERDLVEPQVAYDAAPNAEELKMLLKGISTSQPGMISRRVT